MTTEKLGDQLYYIYGNLHIQIPIVPERRIEVMSIPQTNGTVYLYRPKDIAAIDIHIHGINLLTLHRSGRFFNINEGNTTPILLWYHDIFRRKRRIIVTFGQEQEVNESDPPLPPSA